MSMFSLKICLRQPRLPLLCRKFFQSLPIIQFQSHFHVFKYLLQQHPTSRYQNLYQLGFSQGNRTSRRDILRDLLQRFIPYMIMRAGQASLISTGQAVMKDRLELSAGDEGAIHRWNFFLETSIFAIKGFFFFFLSDRISSAQIIQDNLLKVSWLSYLQNFFTAALRLVFK